MRQKNGQRVQQSPQKREPQMTNDHKKRWSTPLATREMENQGIARYHFVPSWLADVEKNVK